MEKETYENLYKSVKEEMNRHRSRIDEIEKEYIDLIKESFKVKEVK